MNSASKNQAVPNKHTVMVVDDDPDTLEIMGEILRHEGYRVVMARGMLDAIRVLASGIKVQALVADYYIGDGTGVELVSFLGQKRPSVCILISGDPNVRATPEFDTFLVKPIQPTILCGLLRKLLTKAA